MKKLMLLLAILLVATFASAQMGQTVLNNTIPEAFVNTPGAGPNNLGGPGLGRHDIIDPVANVPLGCESCHLPHTAPKYGSSFLWAWSSIPASVGTYVTQTNTGGPLVPPANAAAARTGATRSILCLSCHDATSANANNVVGAFKLTDTVNGVATGVAGFAGPFPNSLAGQHPVDATVPANADYQFVTPAPGSPDEVTDTIGVDIQLPLWGAKVECSSCHDQHNDYTTSVAGGGGYPFLRWANVNGTALCRQCHNK